MFTYEEADDTYTDNGRGIRVAARGGFGPGISSWDASGPGWTFRFGVRRESDQYIFVGDEAVLNPDYHINLFIWTLAPKGRLDDPGLPGALAREFALLRESRLYETDPDRVSIF